MWNFNGMSNVIGKGNYNVFSARFEIKLVKQHEFDLLW
jgi:hypothetical protein